MQIFLDTAIVDEIKAGLETGLVDGVTTNPSHIAAAGRPFLAVVKDILTLVDGPVSIEVVSTDAKGMLAEARKIAAMGKNAVVKVPVIPEGLKAMTWMAKEGIPVNATLCYSPLQAYLAAKAGAKYISPFVGRLDEVGQEGATLVEQIRQIYDNYEYQTQILVAAVRHPAHVLQAALLGADVVTMRYNIFTQLPAHPMTDLGLAKFLEDWKQVPQ